MSEFFSKTINYCRLLLKREWIFLLCYILLIIFLSISQAISFENLYPTPIEREAGAIAMENPAMVALLGPAYRDNGVFTLGALFNNQTILTSSILSAIINIIIVVRNTKADEESGRLELLKSLSIGRLSHYLSVIILIILLNFSVSIFLGLGLYLLDIESLTIIGVFLYSAIISSVGVFFASLTLLFANLFESSQSVYTTSFIFLGTSFLMRAVGDVNKNWLSLFSPLGWVLKSKVFTENNVFFLILFSVLSILLFSIAFFLNYKRDLGDYLFKFKIVNEKHNSFLCRPGGFVWYLLMKNFLIWLISLVIAGLSYGYLLADLDVFVESISAFSPDTTIDNAFDKYISIVSPLLSGVSIIPIISTVKRSIVEEKSGRLEIILSRKVNKIFPLNYLVFYASFQSVIFLLSLSTAFWISGNSSLGQQLDYIMVLKSFFITIPIHYFFLSLTALIVATFPRITNFIWIYYSFSLFMVLFGSVLDLPKFLKSISPFEWFTMYPIKSIDYSNLALVFLFSFLLATLATVQYPLRDKMR